VFLHFLKRVTSCAIEKARPWFRAWLFQWYKKPVCEAAHKRSFYSLACLFVLMFVVKSLLPVKPGLNRFHAVHFAFFFVGKSF
jgi:hypothetical protein